MSHSFSSIKKKQHAVLIGLLKDAENTLFGESHSFSAIHNYEQFINNVPAQSYMDIRTSFEKIKNGAENMYWPGSVQNFAVSAGTSGEGKHLPLTDERLKSDRAFMLKVVTAYLKQRPNVFDLVGSHLSMPGSVEHHNGIKIGEISAFTALNAPSWLRIFQIVDPQKLVHLSFRKKFDLLLEKALSADLKVITAVPSWILTLFQQALQKTGKESIAQLWPNLQLLVCGGVKLANYRHHLEELAQGISPDFIETYGASEGYIGFSNRLHKSDLKMVIDNGIFFECIPQADPDRETAAIKTTVPLWQVEMGVAYSLLLTTNAGLWRYALNDIIEFTSVDPLRFTVKGRLNDMLDDFGEALYIYEAEQALKTTGQEYGEKVDSFCISPMLKAERDLPYHRWFVQFIKPVSPDTLKKIAATVDKKLQNINRHYAIRRESNALGAPEVTRITQADINRWMENNGKANAQGKLPKILDKNTENLID